VNQPTSYDEYIERFHSNQRITGYGLATKTHYPCPFCAAPDWMVAWILETDTAIEKGATCNECGRSAKAIVKQTKGGVTFEFVQTGGDDRPEWLPGEIRRSWLLAWQEPVNQAI
jgi:hypothetical protein